MENLDYCKLQEHKRKLPKLSSLEDVLKESRS